MKQSTTDQVRTSFNLAHKSYGLLMHDISQLSEKKVIYSFDFGLVHPYIFRSSHGSDPQYDSIGRSIFSLISLYSNSFAFTPVLTTPSLLELLDSLEHRYKRISDLLSSSPTIESIRRRLDYSFNAIDSLSNEEVGSISTFISSLRVGDKHDSLDVFLDLLRKDAVSLLGNHIDPKRTRAFREASDQKYQAVLRRMEADRGRTDRRAFDDRRFHYKVDSWNLIVSLISNDLPDIEVNHVCRGGISKYMLAREDKYFIRDPHVPLIRGFSLLRASADGDIQREAAAFVRFGLRDIDEARKYLLTNDLEDLTKEERAELDRVWNKFGRPLFHDYSDPKGGVNLKNALKEIREMEDGKYQSITTTDGLREMFRADADDIRDSVQKVVDIHPEIVSSRLLDDYDLSDDPRIDAIKRQFNL